MEFTIRDIKESEISKVAELLSAAYYDDIFFKWLVPEDDERFDVIKSYYEIYLKSRGCLSHVAVNASNEIIGATVWLPHDADESIYKEIELMAGKNAPQFHFVAHESHNNEPKRQAFYQLVGFGVLKELQGNGIGFALLKHNLDIQDEAGIPTYLEASTPYVEYKPYEYAGVYGKFRYVPYKNFPMMFASNVSLYPLYRPVGGYVFEHEEEEEESTVSNNWFINIDV